MATFPTVIPSQSTTMRKKFRVLKAMFGNGQEQTAPDGSNNVIEEWDIRFDNIGTTDYGLVVTSFLETLTGSETISWNAKLYKISDAGYTVQAYAGSVWSVAFSMRQVWA